MVFLGIDSGTTHIKAAILTDGGRTIDSVTENYELYQRMFRLFKNLRYDYEKHWFQRNDLFKEK